MTHPSLITPPSEANPEHVAFWSHVSEWLQIKSPNTRKNYLVAVRMFCDWLKVEAWSDYEPITSLNPTKAQRFISYVERRSGNAKGRSKAVVKQGDTPIIKAASLTTKSRVATINSMYKYLTHRKNPITGEYYVERSPFDGSVIRKPSGGVERETHALSLEGIYRVIEILQKRGDDKNLALFILAIGCALRKSEMHALKVEDVTLKDGTWLISVWQKKTKKGRVCPLSDDLVGYVDEFLKRRKAIGEPGEALFITRDGNPYSENNIGRALLRVMRKVDGNVMTIHSLRATSITMALEKGASYEDVLLLSGHSSVEMVKVYDKRRREISSNPSKLISF